LAGKFPLATVHQSQVIMDHHNPHSPHRRPVHQADHKARPMAPPRSAAFYDVDGTLIKTNIVHSFAYYAQRQASLTDSAIGTIKTAASIPLFWIADKVSRKWFNQIFYQSYQGWSEDRLVVLADELFEDIIRPNIYPRAKELIAQSKRSGRKQILLSGALDFTMVRLAEYLEVDELIANRLEFLDGYATGKLRKPFVAGATKADIMRDYARKHDIDLAVSHAYSDSFSDYPMLAAVGHPTACNPDFRLRSTARSYDWPILDLREDADRSVANRPQGLAPAGQPRVARSVRKLP
jgi:HAD superfamily hydrolase (TIGR01490 family)